MSESSALSRILGPGGLRPYFQPIVEITRTKAQTHHLECLVRGPLHTNMETANVLFEYVRLKREEIAIDRACTRVALLEGNLLPPGTRFSINVHASTLGRDSGFVTFFLDSIAASGLQNSQISVEIVEHAPPWDNQTFLHAIDALRSNQVTVALDDVGLGQSNFKMILDVRPDFLKIDRYFIQQCHLDPNRQAVIESIQLLGSRFGAEIIAEGVESAEELEFLRKLGLTLFQGYFLGRPATASGYTETKLTVDPSTDGVIIAPHLQLSREM